MSQTSLIGVAIGAWTITFLVGGFLAHEIIRGRRDRRELRDFLRDLRYHMEVGDAHEWLKRQLWTSGGVELTDALVERLADEAERGYDPAKLRPRRKYRVIVNEGLAMRIGTKSLLFGVHQVLIHPWFVAAAWWKLYGFPWDPRLWVAFVVHDWGYWGKASIDGPDGETHPEVGARIMGRLFGPEWHDLVLLHSRFYSKQLGKPYSRLCVADKLSLVLTPTWLQWLQGALTGEGEEMLEQRRTGKYAQMEQMPGEWDNTWIAIESMKSYLRRWVTEHRDLRPDTWTPNL